MSKFWVMPMSFWKLFQIDYVDNQLTFYDIWLKKVQSQLAKMKKKYISYISLP